MRASRWEKYWLFPLLLLAGWLAAAGSAQATALPSVITQNTTLTASCKIYTGLSTIEPGVTVYVEAGTVFKVSRLLVKGILQAEGTAEAPIVFTGAKGERPGEWGNITFESGSGASILDHVEVSYAGNGTSTRGASISTVPHRP